ncbi:hypothetical protein M758_3G209700 [Ceratodon purpureus]|nr:hypothetical protein M758_3G209700 [Ceratodon purpureus]
MTTAQRIVERSFLQHEQRSNANRLPTRHQNSHPAPNQAQTPRLPFTASPVPILQAQTKLKHLHVPSPPRALQNSTKIPHPSPPPQNRATSPQMPPAPKLEFSPFSCAHTFPPPPQRSQNHRNDHNSSSNRAPRVLQQPPTPQLPQTLPKSLLFVTAPKPHPRNVPLSSFSLRFANAPPPPGHGIYDLLRPIIVATNRVRLASAERQVHDLRGVGDMRFCDMEVRDMGLRIIIFKLSDQDLRREHDSVVFFRMCGY